MSYFQHLIEDIQNGTQSWVNRTRPGLSNWYDLAVHKPEKAIKRMAKWPMEKSGPIGTMIGELTHAGYLEEAFQKAATLPEHLQRKLLPRLIYQAGEHQPELLTRYAPLVEKVQDAPAIIAGAKATAENRSFSEIAKAIKENGGNPSRTFRG